MECLKVKQEFPEIDFESCCESCHENADLGFGDDLWFLDPEGKLRYVCCAIGRGLEEE